VGFGRGLHVARAEIRRWTSSGVPLPGIEAKTDWQLSITDNVSGGNFPSSAALGESGPLGRDHRCPRHRGAGRQQVGHPYYFDVGTGDSALTWQGVAASVPVRLGDLQLMYRYTYTT